MDDTPDAIAPQIAEPIKGDPARLREQFERAVRGLGQRQSTTTNPAFRNISIEERQERLLMVELLAQEFLSAEQITDLLPAWGLRIPLSTVYKYLASCRLPKGYKRIVERRSRRVHDGLAVYHLIRLARDAKEAGLKAERILVSRRLSDAPIIPDAYFFVGPNGYFIEEQISPLPDVKWRDKLRAYLKRRIATGDFIRVLFIVNDRPDLVRARQYARDLLKQHGRESMKLFLFTEQLTMKGSRNVVTSDVWQTPWGNHVSLISWMRLPGGSPTVQR